MESGSLQQNSSGFLKEQESTAPVSESYLNDDLYKYIPPPNPLFPKSQFIESTPRCHIPLISLPRLLGNELACSMNDKFLPWTSSTVPAVNLQVFLSQSCSSIVYKRTDDLEFYESSLLNLRKMLKLETNERAKPLTFDHSIQPFYTPTPGDSTLVFESRFESGNLALAAKVSHEEYNLLLQNDINSKGHTQWFYFKVTNTSKATVKFNILNLGKKDSLYNHGLKVLIYSEKEYLLNGTGWFRGGYHIRYTPNGIRKPNTTRTFYTLSFTYDFLHQEDTVYFAYSYPYTYTDLMQDIRHIEEVSESGIVFRKLLCHTISGNRCDYLIITAPGTPDSIRKRKGVFLSARVHPGETVSSWMMKGVLEFLTGSSQEAVLLREHFVFKIIPMLNPDGVICGNYRCNLAGCDLNRRWKVPSKDLHPTVFHSKRLMKSTCKERGLELICDMHGHSRRKNIFTYGCFIKGKPEATRAFPYIVSKSSSFFHYPYCTFKIEKSKESTMRVCMFKETKIPSVYTLEASFCGPSVGEFAGTHFLTSQLMEMGVTICRSLLTYAEIPGNALSVSKEECLQELREDPSLTEDNDADSSSGSDSDPSEDNLGESEYESLVPVDGKKKEKNNRQKKRTTPIKRQVIPVRALSQHKEKKIEIRKCGKCGQPEFVGHTCPKPKIPVPVLKSWATRRPQLYGLSMPYYNAQGKKVRDQATQTEIFLRSDARKNQSLDLTNAVISNISRCN